MYKGLCLASILLLTACGEETNDSDNDGVINSEDCAPDDKNAYHLLSYAGMDGDLDGNTIPLKGSICTGEQLPSVYVSTLAANLPIDCDDTDKDVWSTVSVYVDNDNDGVGAGEIIEKCIGASLPPNTSYGNTDCNDDDNNQWLSIDYNSVDLDLDGKWISSEGASCTNGSLPIGYSSVNTELSQVDCDDTDKDVWSTVSVYADNDSDGVGAGARIEQCTKNNIPESFSTKSYDCDDTESSLWRMSVIYQDYDGDGIGSGLGSVECIGSSPQLGYSIHGYDPVDNILLPDSSTIIESELPPIIISVMESGYDPDKI